MPDYRTSPLRDQLGALLSEGERVMAGRHDRATAGLNAADRTDPGFRLELPRAASEDDETPDGGEPVTSKEGDLAKLYIYSEIGGWFGVWPEEVVRSLADVKGDVELHIHSPGGDAFDGVAIYNALRSHPGKIFGVIDGLAASAASVIAMAADELEVKRGGQLMIHDAWGFTQGNQADHDKTGEFLGKISDSIASIYAARAGGTLEEWRKAMRDESWYTDREAVEAGLADRLETSQAAAKNQWNLRVFAHAGRQDAPDPRMPAGRYALGQWGTVMARTMPPGATSTTPDPQPLVTLDALRADADRREQAPGETPAQAAARMHAAAQRVAQQTPVATSALGPTPSEGGANMEFDPTKIREALGLGPDATDEQVQTAWASAFAAPAPVAPATAPVATGTVVETSSLGALAQAAENLGVAMIDRGQLDEMRQMAARGQAAYDTQRRNERDQEIDKALNLGKIPVARVDHWRKSWDADPEGTREMLQGLKPNMVPMEPGGYASSVVTTESEAAYLGMYPEDKPGAKGGRL